MLHQPEEYVIIEIVFLKGQESVMLMPVQKVVQGVCGTGRNYSRNAENVKTKASSPGKQRKKRRGVSEERTGFVRKSQG